MNTMHLTAIRLICSSFFIKMSWHFGQCTRCSVSLLETGVTILYKTDMVSAPKILQSSEKEIKQVVKYINDTVLFMKLSMHNTFY